MAELVFEPNRREARPLDGGQPILRRNVAAVSVVLAELGEQCAQLPGAP